MKKNIIFITCLMMICWACSHKHDHNHDHNHNHDTSESHEHQSCSQEDGHDHAGHDAHETEKKEEFDHELNHDEVILTPQQAGYVGLEVQTIQPDIFSQVIKTSGQILSSQGDETILSAATSGIVSYGKRTITEGIPVRLGEVLLSISSKNMESGDIAVKARVSYQIARKEYERAESLIKEKLISEKEYNQTKLEYENAKVAYEALNKTTGGAGVSVMSGISGFVKSIWVKEGEFVEAGAPLLVVSQNRKLQLKADVSERYYTGLGQISSANFKTPYSDEIHKLSDMNGKLISFGRASGSNEHYIPVVFEFDNVGKLFSGTYVEVYLLSNPRKDVIAVPVSALMESQESFYVYIRLNEEKYKKQEVIPGSSDGERVEILSGLKRGDVLVSKGANHLKNASATMSIPHGHSH